MFQNVEGSVRFPDLEARIGQFWKERRIYEQSLKQRAGATPFVFYEGPPTANGMPHPGHCLTRAIKDLFPRYRTMRGYLCERKAGWDTHGLPVEVEVCKELGIHSKEEIEAYGIEPFIHKCQESVWRYMQQWERLTERLGFWIHLDQAYVTYHQSFVESVWWSLKNLFDRNLLYQGHKIVWWWAQGGTALSSGEVGQGYREVADPSVYVKFPIVMDNRAKKLGIEDGTSLLVWTTTPWTLPSNQFAAVHPDLEYSLVEDAEKKQRVIVASALVETIAQKAKLELAVVNTFPGKDLIGLRYLPPFNYYYQTLGDVQGKLADGGEEYIAWRVVPAPFVTTDSGSGVVHQAPAFGEVDYDVLIEQGARFVTNQGPELICAVGPDGKFTAEAPDYQGRWVKDCDKDIIRALKENGRFFWQEQILHEYPFCWRAEEDPLIQYPRKSWFIRTTQFKDAMVENNKHINWLPEHIRDGRFGNFLESNVDWALSRERYWGTPLPIWVCEETGYMEAIGSYDELLAKPDVTGTEVWAAAKKAKPDLPDDLKVHKPYIDAITYDSPKARGKRMRRVTEVIDCWYDSGAMPFAQWGYPNQWGSEEKFKENFPADFISEAIDQTRGWFYSQLAISTLLFSDAKNDTPGIKEPVPYPHPFKNCIVLGLMLSEWWESKSGKSVYLTEEDARNAEGEHGFTHEVGKMSKSKRNYREPNEIFDRYGADALRWYFFANQPPWTSIRYSEQSIKDSIPEFLLRLWNVYSFFVIYANIDEFDPAAELPDKKASVGQLETSVLSQAKSWSELSERKPIDRWIIGELNNTAAQVTQSMDAYNNYAACQKIIEFVDALSNWYVRRTRDRFWSKDKRAQDKLDAYWTLYECLLTTSRMIAPFVPFLAEEFWQNLAVAPFGEQTRESVHLCDFPTGDLSLYDETLASLMSLGREISSLGRAARTTAGIKVRQPLAKVEVILVEDRHRGALEEYKSLICDELNVKEAEFTDDMDRYVTVTVLPDLKKLGPRFGKQLPEIKKALGAVHGNDLLAEFKKNGQYTLKLPSGPIELQQDEVQVRLMAKDGWTAAQGTQCVVVLATELTEELVQEGLARDLIRLIQDRRKEIGCDFTDRIQVAIATASSELANAIEVFKEYIQTETLTDKLGVTVVGALEKAADLIQVADIEARMEVKALPKK